MKAWLVRVKDQYCATVVFAETRGKAKWSFCNNDFGKTVFLTKEEAERKLREVGE